MEGWICLHRKIRDHWIWNDANKLKWWIDLLLSVNHSDSKVNIGLELYDCKRGQSIRSLKTWADSWGVSKDTARNFFTLLVKDNMIITENLKKTTRITICNYDDYQDDLHIEQTPSKRQATQTTMNNNDNNKNNVIFDEFRKAYPGIKRGLETEFLNLKKKYRDWPEILPLLKPALEKLIAWRESASKAGKFVSDWPNLQTWINQRRWEAELPKLTNNEEPNNIPRRKATDIS